MLALDEPLPGLNARVILVCGPHGAGKSTFIRKHKRAGDLWINSDALMGALAGIGPHEGAPDEILPYMRFVVDSLTGLVVEEQAKIRRTGPSALYARRIWHECLGPSLKIRTRDRKALSAQTVVLETPADVCIQRCSTRPAAIMRPDVMAGYKHRIEAWWREYEPSDNDIIVRP